MIGAHLRARQPAWDTGAMRWTVHSEKPLYEDEWLDIRLADVELPDGATWSTG